jgi:hypothetical protein
VYIFLHHPDRVVAQDGSQRCEVDARFGHSRRERMPEIVDHKAQWESRLERRRT